MKDKKPDAIKQLASIGSVSFVILRIAWDIANAQWMHLLCYGLFFTAICAICVFTALPFSDGDEDPLPH